MLLLTMTADWLFVQVLLRDDDTWTNIPTDVNSACGGWARLPDGRVGMFAGHYPTLQNKQVSAAAEWHTAASSCTCRHMLLCWKFGDVVLV